MLTVTWRCNRK